MPPLVLQLHQQLLDLLLQFPVKYQTTIKIADNQSSQNVIDQLRICFPETVPVPTITISGPAKLPVVLVTWYFV